MFDTGGVYLIKAIPIARGVGADVLSYWSPKSPETGSVIRVPLRKRTVGALVLTSEPALELKTEIRSADFELKKISNPHSKSIIFPQFFKTAEEIARYYASTVGSALFELLPATILAEYEKLPVAKEMIQRKRPRESFALQKNDEDRFAHYKSLIRERFARKESVFMMMPTVEDIKKACSYFEKGIEPYTYILHGGLSKTEIVKIWKAAVEDPHQVIMFEDRNFIPRGGNRIG